MILDNEDLKQHPLQPTSTDKDMIGQENEHSSTLSGEPGSQTHGHFIPLTSNPASSSCDFLSSDPTGHQLQQSLHSGKMPAATARRTPLSADSSRFGLGLTEKFTNGNNDMEQLENDDPFPKHFWSSEQLVMGSGSGSKMSSDKEVCDLFRQQLGPQTYEHLKLFIDDKDRPRSGFQKWQLSSRLGEGQCPASSRSFMGGSVYRRRGQLRDLNIFPSTSTTMIQRPSLDFDKMLRYSLKKVLHPAHGVSKPRVIKVKSLRGQSSSSSSLGAAGSEFLDPSIFSFRSISQNFGGTVPNISDEN